MQDQQAQRQQEAGSPPRDHRARVPRLCSQQRARRLDFSIESAFIKLNMDRPRKMNEMIIHEVLNHAGRYMTWSSHSSSLSGSIVKLATTPVPVPVVTDKSKETVASIPLYSKTRVLLHKVSVKFIVFMQNM